MPLVMILPFLVMLNGLRIPLGDASVGIDQVAACVLLVPLGVAALLGTKRVRTDSTVWWLSAILAANVAASLLFSPALSYSLVQCANLASVWVIYLVLLNALDSRESLEQFLRSVLWAATLGSALGIGAFVLALSGIRVGGAEVSSAAASRFTQAYGAYGVMVEPNIFGSFAAAHLVLATLLLVARPRLVLDAATVRLARWTAALTLVALAVSFTRAAWIGAIAGLLAAALLGRRRFGARAIGRVLAVSTVAVLATGALLFFALPDDALALMRFKLLNLVNLQSQTALLRIITYGLALDQTLVHPIVGWGTFTFAPLVAEGSDFRQFENWRNLWIGNYVLLALHDTGLIGLSCWVGMLWSVLARAVRGARSVAPIDAMIAGRTLALAAAVVSLLVPFLATSGFSLGYPWMLIGLLGAHAHWTPATAHAPELVGVRAPVMAMAPDAIS